MTLKGPSHGGRGVVGTPPHKSVDVARRRLHERGPPERARALSRQPVGGDNRDHGVAASEQVVEQASPDESTSISTQTSNNTDDSRGGCGWRQRGPLHLAAIDAWDAQAARQPNRR
ncbi:hypothetical protein pCM2_0051 (plasmid) [Clavibacter michiganensis subsp. michiganensis NCPPB 382]|uniref:Uncharacterized protein n=1 Tax=Clavibacter michiganensis subsp. michiganensis (strain NCPPB 382) TaxID=443906 RepID=A5CLR4_CLAM3|nr:hypothetical protein pCM2_0051 [Clavibacter michiganensis subsp. michiganensis NCPPB 382]